MGRRGAQDLRMGGWSHLPKAVRVMAVTTYDYEATAQRVVDALREHFPTDTIDTRPGFQGRVHLILVSRRFNGLTERQKQDLIWEILKATLGDDLPAVSMAIVYGTDEL